MPNFLLCVLLLGGFLSSGSGVSATTFELINKCSHAIWPAIQPNAGKPGIANGGFLLQSGHFTRLTAPTGWAGRFWGRTGCSYDGSGNFICATGDCGRVVQCNGAGGNPPATLFEITLAGYEGKDFYDVSLVDGYNLEISVAPSGGHGNCNTIGCTSDLVRACPESLQLKYKNQIVGCKSACQAFGAPMYCCTGAYGSPQTCHATPYSRIFKHACPKAYSYAYDDASSTFTCATAKQYSIVFCPSNR